MSKITKLYENAGVSRCPAIIPSSGEVIYWEGYPPFTAEKQIGLIKLLAEKDNIYITHYPSDNTYNIRYCVSGFYDGSIMGDKEVTNANFGEALAGTINILWQDLSEEEKQQVKGILE